MQIETEDDYVLTKSDIDLMRFYPKYADVKSSSLLPPVKFIVEVSHIHISKMEEFSPFETSKMEELNLCETGEILFSDPASTFWKGMMIDLYRLKKGKEISCIFPAKEQSIITNYMANRIKKINRAES